MLPERRISLFEPGLDIDLEDVPRPCQRNLVDLIGVLDQFMELLGHLETTLFAGAFIRPMGLLGLNFIEGDVRTLGEVPIRGYDRPMAVFRLG